MGVALLNAMALIGRFLPKTSSRGVLPAVFFFLFSRLRRPEGEWRDPRQLRNERLEIGAQRREPFMSHEPRLIEIKRAINLNLQDMDAHLRATVGARDISARIGGIARHTITERCQRVFHHMGEARGA